MTFCMCLSLYDGNKHCVEHYDCRKSQLKILHCVLFDHAISKLTYM